MIQEIITYIILVTVAVYLLYKLLFKNSKKKGRGCSCGSGCTTSKNLKMLR